MADTTPAPIGADALREALIEAQAGLEFAAARLPAQVGDFVPSHLAALKIVNAALASAAAPHDWRVSPAYGGEICANCGAVKGTRRGNAHCREVAAPTTQAAPAAVAGQCEDAIELLGKYKELCEEIKRGDSYHLGRIDSAISVLAQTAPQPAVQQGGPVVWRSWDSENSRWNFTLWPDEWAGHADAWEPLYTHPAAPAAQGDALGQPIGFIKPDSASHVYFYEQDFYVLSNFSAFSLMWGGLRFDTSEAAYHWEKFPLSPGTRLAIRDAKSAHEAFKIAERNKFARRKDWDDVKVGIMRSILRAKVQQHEYVRRKLLATGDRMLVEDSWRDDFWGWGPNRDGQNMLGKLWMEVRAELVAARSQSKEGGEA